MDHDYKSVLPNSPYGLNLLIISCPKCILNMSVNQNWVLRLLGIVWFRLVHLPPGSRDISPRRVYM